MHGLDELCVLTSKLLLILKQGYSISWLWTVSGKARLCLQCLLPLAGPSVFIISLEREYNYYVFRRVLYITEVGLHSECGINSNGTIVHVYVCVELATKQT